MKIHVCIPALDTCPTPFAMALAAMMQHVAYDKKLRKEITLSLASVQGSMVWDSRNLLAQNALDINASHLMFIDSDMVFPPDAVSVLASHHKPIVGASYVKRYPPHPIMGLPAGTYNPDLLPLAEMLTLPLGLALIRTEVFRRIPAPWFAYTKGPTPDLDISEDTHFCNLARAAGFPIYADVNLTAHVGHVGQKTFTLQDIQK